MSFGLPAVKVKPEHAASPDLQEGPFGIPNVLTSGVSATRSKLGLVHPLEQSEKNYDLNQQRMSMQMMRNHGGIAGPLKMTMELKAANKVGRLPFLESSHMMRDVLLGNDINLGFEDFLNTPEFCEVAGQPHAVVEKSLGLL